MPGHAQCLADAEMRARSAYASPDRHYHDQRHLDECLSLLDLVDGLSDQNRRVLRWAILWHDAIYDPGRSDNEKRSAELAQRELAGCGATDSEGAEVARLIRLTKAHRVAPSDRLGAIMVSIDLAILGAEAERYREYVVGVRREYAHVTDEAWREGRADVLAKLLASKPLYPDPRLGARLEERARANILGELSSLRGG